MPEKKLKRRNSEPSLRAQSARESVPGSSGVLAQLPNSARVSMAEPESGSLDALAEKFAQHRLPSEERNDSILPDAVPQLDEEGIGQLRNELAEDQAQPASRMKKAGFFSRMGAGIWDSVVGSMVRRHRRAYDDIMEHKQDKSYYKIGGVNRFLYFMNNPLAVMRSWGSKDKWNETHDRKMQEEQDRIARYQAENNVQALDHDSYRWGTDSVQSENVRPGEQASGQKKKEEEKIVGDAAYGPSFSVTDTLIKDIPTVDAVLQLDQVKDLPAAKWFTRTDRQFLPEDMMEEASINDMAIMMGSTLKTLKGIKGVAKSISDAKKSMATGLTGKKTNAVLTVLSSIFSTARMAGMAAGKIGSKFKKLMPERVAKVLGWSGKPFAKLFGKDFNALNAFGAAAGGINALKGGVDTLGSVRTKWKLRDVKDSLENEGLAEGEKTSLSKLTRQAGSAANQRLINGVSGMLNGVAGSAGTLSLPIPSAVTKVGGKGLEKMTGLISGMHQSSMDRKVLKEDMPELDDKIEAYARKLAEDKGLDPENVGAMEQKRLRRQAKHIILKAHGFSSGKRSEAVAFFNTARAKYLAGRANRQQEGSSGDSIAQDLVDAIGVNRRSNGFNEDDIAARLGRTREQDDVIASRRSNIEALAQKKNRGFWNNTKRLLGWMFS